MPIFLSKIFSLWNNAQWVSFAFVRRCVQGREEPLDVGAEGPDTQTCQHTNVKETNCKANCFTLRILAASQQKKTFGGLTKLCMAQLALLYLEWVRF